MIHKISLRVNAHATEDEYRVKKALELFLPQDKIIEKSVVYGHFGNPIKIFQVDLKKKTECKYFIDFIKEKLNKEDLFNLNQEIADRVDNDCNFYLRFDKQSAYKGEVKLSDSGDSIAVGVKIASYPAKRDKAIDIAKKLLKNEIL
ncbi:MAG: RNA-binding domain-containing protein [Methanosarcinales archaeon]